MQSPALLAFCLPLCPLHLLLPPARRASRTEPPPKMGTPLPVSIHDCVLPVSGLRARIFYPCASSAPSRRARWFPASATLFPDENAVGIAEYLRLPFPGLLSPVISAMLGATLPVAADAAPAAGRFPVALFSHGLGGCIAGYSAACAALAATGRVVVAPEHADGSAFAAFTGAGRARVPYTRAPPGGDDFAFRHRQLRQRVRELAAVLEDVRAIAAGESAQTPLPGRGGSGAVVPFEGCMESGEIAVAGHSFGAGSALAFCFAAVRGEIEARVAEVVCLDPWLYPLGRAMVERGDVGDARVLFVDQELSGMRESIGLRKAMRRAGGKGGFWSVMVRGGGHNNSSDFATRLPRFVAVAAGITPAVGEPEVLMKAQNDAVVAFVQRDGWGKYWEDVKEGRVEGLASSVLPDAVAVQEAA